jgi:hypothetical protein
MLRAIVELQSDVCPFCEWKASSKGQRRNLAAALLREARAVAPNALSSLRICVQERMAAPQ